MRVDLGVSTPDDPPGRPTPCSVRVDLFLHPLLEEPPRRPTTTPQTWSEYESLVGQARQACATCPLLADCLYKAVVHTDVSGYVGCTTPAERDAIRTAIGVQVGTEDFDSYAGARGERQPLDHDDVLRARAQNPGDSLEALAARLECSLSTVKRHLRRARREAAHGALPLIPTAPPTMDDVFDAFDEVVEARRVR